MSIYCLILYLNFCIIVFILPETHQMYLFILILLQ